MLATSWFSILFPSVMFIKSCGRLLTPGGGQRIEVQETRQAQTEADASEWERARPSGVELRYGTSFQKRLPPPCFWAAARERGPGCDGLAPWANTASQYTAPNSLNKHCSLSVSATGKPGSDQLPPFLWCFICIYIYEYEYIVRMCMNVVVFLIHSEKYARYYYDLSPLRFCAHRLFSPLLFSSSLTFYC